MRKMTIEEMEYEDAKADMLIEEEKIRQYEEARERAAKKGPESL